MAQGSSSDEMRRYADFHVFRNDGTIDAWELRQLLTLAFKDKKIDETERGVLHDVFSRVTQNSVEPAVWQWMNEIRTIHNI